MPKTEIGLDRGGGSIAKIAFEIQNIHASGGPEFPKLTFPLEIKLTAIQEYQKPVHAVTLMLLRGELYSPQQTQVTTFSDDTALFAGANHAPERQLRLEIPLDLTTVARMEQSREGDLWAGLKFCALFAIHVSPEGVVERFETGTTEPLYFAIPKSQWLEKLLPQLGYGRLELIEVRISNGARPEGIPKAVEEIRQARAYLADGDWGKAVTHCRNTLETILSSRQLQVPPASKFRSKVDAFVNDHIGSKLADKQAKLLADEMNLLWEVCSEAAHPTVPDYFKRADANFIVQNTTAILEYVSKLLA